MTRSSKHYRAPTRVRRPNHLPVIFNTARLRSASSRVRRLARTVLRVYVYSLLLLLAVRSCVQVIGYTAEAVKTLATDPNQSNLSLASDQSPDECPLTEVIDDCLSSLFGKWAWHGSGDCDVDYPQVAVNESEGHLSTCLIEVPLQDTLQNQTGGQCQLFLPVASYSTAFKTLFHGITFPIDFILWHTTVVALNMFVHISLILYEFGPPLWTMKREAWRHIKKKASLSGKRGISCCRKTRVFLCVYLCALSTHCLCMAVLKRFKHQALSKGQVEKLTSLGLQRGVKCGQNIHGRLVTSFTVQKCFVMRIRVRPHWPCPVLQRHVEHLSESLAKAVSSIRLPALPNPAACRLSTFCYAFLRRAVCIGKWLSQAVVKPYIFLRGLLLLAGDIEQNPGPLQAEGILKEYRDRFIAEMDASTIVSDFVYHGIIPDGVLESITKADGPRQRNSILHDCLLRTCTNKALITACGIIASVQGNPRMSALGKDMQRRLESVEGGGGRGEVGGEGMRGEGQVESFFGRLRNFYTNMKVVEDEWLPADQSLRYVNLALAPFKLGHQHTHETFVEAVKEGVDHVFTNKTGKVKCEEIPKLVKEHKLVVVSGAPGVGKSTIARKVCKDICQAPECCGYVLVLLVELRDLLLFKKDFQLVNILQLFQGMMRDATSPKELSKAIFSNQGKDMLFILDGFDELPPHLRQSAFLMNLLSHNLDSPLRDCDVVLTSRSIVTSEIYHNMRQSRAQVSLANIEVLGFTQDQIKEYAGQYFKGQGRPDLLESFVSKINAIPQVRGLCSIPVVLSIICQVYSFKEDLPPTLTQLYNEYLCIKVLKYSIDLTTLDSILDLPDDHDIYKLGEIAFDCIQRQKVVFNSCDLQGLGEHFADRIKGCGVLTARPVRANPKSKKVAVESYYFIHLTVQEFIAAVYVSLLPAEEQRKIWSKYLGEPHMAQVWRFYCGLTQLAHYELLQANITGYPEDFQMQCLFESQNASLVYKLMPCLVRKQVEVKPKTVYDSMAYGYCLSKHPALQTLAIHCQEGVDFRDDHQRLISFDPSTLQPLYPLQERSLQNLTTERQEGVGSVEIHRLLEPVYASGTLQTLCLPRGSDWRDVEAALNRLVSTKREAITGDSQKDGALKGQFGKVFLASPPLSVVMTVLCLQHVREFDLWQIQGCEAMNHEVLKEMGKALEESKTLEKLTLNSIEILPKDFCRHIVFGTRHTSLSKIDLTFHPKTWDFPSKVPAGIHRNVQHVSLCYVPVDVLPRVLKWFSQAKHLECFNISPPQEAMDCEVLKETKMALAENKTLEKLTLSNHTDVILPKEFCRQVVFGTRLNTSLSQLRLTFHPESWDCPYYAPADVHGNIQLVSLHKVPVDVLPRLLRWFSQAKHLVCHDIHPPQEAVDHEVLKEIEKALEENKTFDKLTLSADPTLPKEFHCQFVFGNGQSTSLSDMRHFRPESYHCHMDGPTSHLPEVGAGVSPAPHGHECGSPPLHHTPSHQQHAGPVHHPLEDGPGVSPALHGHDCGPPPSQYLPSHQQHAADRCSCCTVL